jgi:hypothetical protein
MDVTAVEGVVGAGNEAGFVGTDPGGERGYLFGLRHAADGLGGSEFLHHLGFATGIVFGDEPVNKGCVNAGRGNGVTANFFAEIVAGDGVGHGENGALGRGIGEAIRQASHSGDGSHIEDDAAAVLAHGLENRAGTEIDTTDIDAHETVEVGFRSGGESAYVSDAGAVDKDVNRAKGEDGLERAMDGGGVGDVAGEGPGSRSDPGDGGVRSRLIEIDEADAGAMAGEGVGDGEADTAGSACDDGVFAGKKGGVLGGGFLHGRGASDRVTWRRRPSFSRLPFRMMIFPYQG